MHSLQHEIHALHYGLQAAAAIASLYLVYILTSLFYNAHLHPLSKYPGPKLWAASNLPNFLYTVRGTRVYKVAEFHEKYGPVVRVSPTELSYIDETVWKDIYSSHKTGQLRRDLVPAVKVEEAVDLFSQPNDQTHARMRKKLSPVFSDKSLRERESILQKFSDLLIKRLKETSKKTDILHWYDCTSSDITGQLVFGESFHSLETGKLHPIIPAQAKLLEGRPFRWIWYKDPVLRLLSRGGSEKMSPHAQVFGRTVAEKMASRKARHEEAGAADDIPDFMAVIATDVGASKGLSKAEASAIGIDFLVAGSDTVATALSASTYFLTQNPTKVELLQKEVRGTFKSLQDITIANVSGLKYLNAVLSEAMRLHPAVPEPSRRVTGPQGCVIRGEFVPPGISVSVLHWAAGHSSFSWKDAESFVPERWLDDEAYKNDNRGVVQFFNTGPRNCVGQNLAWAEMRLILAKLVFVFDIQLCEESKNWKDMLVYGLAYVKKPLMVRVTPVM